MAEPTALDDAIKAVGGETGQPGMLTPQQITAIEEARARGEKPPEFGEKPPEGGEKPPEKQPEGEKQPEFDHDALLAKVEKGEELSADEQAQLAIIRKELELAPAAPAPTYNIAGKVLTQEEVDAKVREEFFGELDVSPERMAKAREVWVKAQNRTEQQVTVQKQSEVNAADRQAIIAARMMIQNDVDRKKAERERIRHEIEVLRARAAVQLKEDDLYTAEGRLDLIKHAQYTRAQEATELLPLREQEAAAIEDQIASAAKEMVKSDINALVAIAPQYKMAVDVFTAYDQLTKGGTLDPVDKLKVLELDDMVKAARSKGIALEDEYTLRKEAGRLAVKPVAQSTGPGKPRLPELPNNSQSVAEMIRKHKARMAAAPPGAGGGGGGRSAPDNRSEAARLVAHDKEVLGTQPDPFLKEVGY